jgi:penicillin-binding protein A
VNPPIRRVAIFCFLLIVSLLVSSNYIQVVNADSYKARSKNARNVIDAFAYPRGQIRTADGLVIAQSVPSGGINYKYQRQYPQGPLYANITGYRSMGFGATGIEGQLDQFLQGNNSSLAVDNFMDTITGKSRKGGDVQLTINSKVQKAAADAMQGKEGSVVALDPATGAILALYSNPTFDPNGVASNDGSVSGAAAIALNKNPAKPNLNHALGETYPPGSIFKVVTAAAALDDSNGKFNATGPTGAPTDHVSFPGSNYTLPNENNETCPGDTLTIALQNSCNSVFGWVGLQVGPQAMADTADKFGLNLAGVSTPLPVVKSVFPAGLTANSASLAQASIGQFETRITPLQAAMMAAAVADGGTIMQPYLVAKQFSDRGSEVSSTKPKTLSQAMSPDTAKAIGDMMVNVVQNGTGTNAKISGVTVGGKTGTAQRGAGQNPLAWFISYASLNGKSVAVAVLVQDDQASRQDISGGGFAAPVAKQVMQAVLGVQ